MSRSLLAAVAAAVLTSTFAGAAHASTTLSNSVFNLWETCSPNAYDYSSTGLILPVGSCDPDYVGAVEQYSQVATGFSFSGAFYEVNGSPSSADQEAVFLCDNDSSFQGHEFGFVKTLNNGVLQAYMQDPPGGNGHYWTVPISTGDNGTHTFAAKCAASYGGSAEQIDYYVDGNYVTSIVNPHGESYESLNYYYVATTQNTSGGFSPGGDQLEIWNGMDVY